MKRLYGWTPATFEMNWKIGLVCCFMLLSIFMTGCGKKALPVPPPEEIPPGVTDLTADLHGEVLTLSWSVPKGEDEDLVVGYKIYRSEAPMQGTDCRDCPVTFRMLDDIMVDDPGVTDPENGKMRYTRILEPDEPEIELSGASEHEEPLAEEAAMPESRIGHQYKVVGYTEYNVRSPDSNVVSAGHGIGMEKTGQVQGGHEE